jgi:type II secretory pathway pseudopilin PulG
MLLVDDAVADACHPRQFCRMADCSEKSARKKAGLAFTLVEVVLSLAILALVLGGMIYGYVQTNYRAEWSSMSLAAQSLAAQAVEQVRAAQWALNGGIVTNQLQLLPPTYWQTNMMLIPTTGRPTNVVTTVNITNISANPPLYQFRADCVWYFPRTGTAFTNTVITLRAPDQ